MIITNEILEEKFNKKLTPNRFKVVVSFLNFILTEDSSGLVIYSENNFWKPFEYTEQLNIKKIKAKTYGDLILKCNKNCDDTKKLVKKGKTSFFDTFDTTCEVNVEKEMFEFNLEDNKVVLTKHIVCVIKELDNIERAFNKEGSKCRVVPLKELFNNKENIEIENWLKYFFKNV